MEKIEVRYSYIENIPTPWDNFHKSIIYTNSNDERFVAEAKATNPNNRAPNALYLAETGQGSPFGSIKAEFHPDSDINIDPKYAETIIAADNLSKEWQIIKDTIAFIGNGNTPYKLWSQNSTYTVSGHAL